MCTDGLRYSELEPVVYRWIEVLRAGKVSSEDGHRPVRPVSVKNEQTVLLVKKPIEKNPHKTICEMCEKYDVSIDTAKRIVRDDLNMKKKIVTRWIPHLPSDQPKKQS